MYDEYVYDLYLQHHGIKGMKWGIRRYQNPDGTLTAKGKERYSDDPNKKKMNKDDISEEERKRRNIKIALGVTVGVAAAAAATYVGYQYYRDNIDKTIKAGTIVSRYTPSNNPLKTDKVNPLDPFDKMTLNSDQHPFYASYKKLDREYIYKGKLVAEHFGLRYGADDVLEYNLSSDHNLKIAGDKAAKKVFNRLVKDAKYDKNNPFYEYRNRNKKQLKYEYRLFNQNLVGGGNGVRGEMFYNALKKKGYSGVSDVNDRRHSGYEASNPIIIFDTGKMIVNTARHLSPSDEEVKKAYALSIPIIMAKQAAPAAAIVGSSSLALGSKIKYNNSLERINSESTIVNNYRKEHPNSKLSYQEILDNYYEKNR